MATIIDYASGPPSAASIKAAGHVGVIRYISPARAAWMTGKPLKKAEVDDLKRHGLKIAAVWQYGAGNAQESDVMRGHAGGVADAKKADAHLKSVGLSGHPVFFAVDFDASLAQWNQTIVNYFKGAASVLGRQRVGIYGHSRAVHWAMEDNVVATVAPGRVLGWITRSWSNGVVGANYSVLYQRVHNTTGPSGVQIDINDVQHSEWGWRAIHTAKEPEVDVANLPKVDVTRWLNKHYTSGRAGKKIQYITRHHLAGIGDTNTVWGWWQTRQASAHFVVHQDGKIGQLVRESDTAWSNANAASNNVSVSIEHNNSAGAAQDWPISNTVIDAGARLAAELCLKHGLGRPQFGKNIRDHREFGSTSCPHHLANGGKYHARWMRVAQEHYDALASGAAGGGSQSGSTNPGSNSGANKGDNMTPAQEKLLREVHFQLLNKWPQLGGLTLVDAVSRLSDQVYGPEKKDGKYAYSGWSGIEGNGGKTLIEAVAEIQAAVSEKEGN